MDTEIELAQDAWYDALQSEIGYADHEADAFLAYVANNYHRPTKDDYLEAYGAFEDAYEGEWGSLGDFCQEQFESCYGYGDLPSWVANHIDWEEVWEHELRHDHVAISVDGDDQGPYWVFRNV